ncbi:urate oxidase [Nocardioides sp. MAH-18]|uniref:Uricase n=1 Tax=Nocardioides agri TaxID=2682843 RepID=A0A6L6XTD1_9ACTN|nr:MULTISPECIES: urate oxidase [unclassified Nocardioides]MBA2954042.1 urate oxidase [Nocardioides sp. CGMCC 1.13656]MVQ48905.1 urate oxidase [Nocardioides sp. MAH-18]
MARIVLGPNQYGKAEVRLVRVDRGSDRHTIADLNITTQLRGDFTACHTEGDNGHVVPTDTQKNTVYAFARDGVGAPEDFLLRLARHFTSAHAWVTGAHLSAEQYSWQRLGDHSFARAGRETRTASVEVDGESVVVTAGLKDCTVLKSTDSEFHGFPRDRYTTLPETSDRILATNVTAAWTYGRDGLDYDATYAGVRDLLLETFAAHHSLALQQTIFAMGEAVLERYDEIESVNLACPNKHHFLVDLEPFGLDNPGEVFFAADRPYGLIQATVLREHG